MLKILSDTDIHKLTDHWNPIPSRLDGLVPETIKLKMFQAVARKAEQEIKRQILDKMTICCLPNTEGERLEKFVKLHDDLAKELKNNLEEK